MKNFFGSLALKFRQFMIGRYGIDRVWTVLMIAYIIDIIAANILFRLSKISYYAMSALGAFIIIFALYRVFSKNIEARRNEYNNWMKAEWKIKSFFRLGKERFAQRKTHKFVKCKKCKKVLRLPKHKGKINVTCPHCSNEFIINTGKKG